MTLRLNGSTAERNEPMADSEKNNFGAMAALTLEVISSKGNMSETDKQQIDNAAKVALMAAISAAKQTGIKTSIALYNIGAAINNKAIEQYVKERSD